MAPGWSSSFLVRGGDRLDEPALRAAQAAVDYVRSELVALAAQIPDAGALHWRSAAQRRFQTGIDELTGSIGDAIAALDHAARELAVIPVDQLGPRAASVDAARSESAG
ncbi:hypothetical protein [Humibacter sp.]|uniref:hypothetical protein n=1 Tax=Humibacter sp. TaxID=1940291 RepID=UPI003F7FA162